MIFRLCLNRDSRVIYDLLELENRFNVCKLPVIGQAY